MKTLLRNAAMLSALFVSVGCNKDEDITSDTLQEVTANQSYGEKVDQLAQTVAELVKGKPEDG